MDERPSRYIDVHSALILIERREKELFVSHVLPSYTSFFRTEMPVDKRELYNIAEHNLAAVRCGVGLNVALR